MFEIKNTAGGLSYHYGLSIVVSPLLTKPKLRFNWPEPTPAMQEFNRWLLDNFGSVSSNEAIKVGDTLYVSAEMFRRLRELDVWTR